MKNKLISIFKNKRVILVIVLVLIALAIGLTTYAVWTTYFSQTDTSNITAKCFKTEFSDGAGINIIDMYPTTDIDGMTTTPYTFTISNTCDTVAQYQINIEILNTTTLEEQYVKVALDEEISILSNNEAVTPTLDNSSKSYKLKTGVLAQENTKTFDLRTWLDENTTGEQGSNKIFETRITITTTPVANMNFLVESENWNEENQIDETTSFLASPIQRQQIEAIEFANHKTIPPTATGSWDVSADQDKRIMAWYEPIGSNGRYKVTIGSDEQIYANPNSSHLFMDIRNLNLINFNNNFNTSFVTNMDSMFSHAGYNSQTFTLDISSFDTSNVTDMNFLFSHAGFTNQNFTLDISALNTSNVTSMNNMFAHTGENSTTFTLNLSDLNTSKVKSMANIFYNVGSNNPNFALNVSSLDTSQVTNMYAMFYGVGQNNPSFTLDLSSLNTSKVTNMAYMFANAAKNTTNFTLDLREMDTSQVTNMHRMFYNLGQNSQNLTLLLDNNNLSEGFNTSKVTNMSEMFYQTGFEDGSFQLNLTDFDTSNVINMGRMFYQTAYNNASFTLDLRSFNTSNVENMEGMFIRTAYDSTDTNLLLDRNKFTTSKVTDMAHMFYALGENDSTFTLDIGWFDTSKVTNMYAMFYQTGFANTNFSLNIQSLTFSSIPNAAAVNNMFANSKLKNLYVKDATVANYINSTVTPLPSGLNIINCSTSSVC